MAKLVDALVSGTSSRKGVQVRFLFWAQKITEGSAGVLGTKNRSTSDKRRAL